MGGQVEKSVAVNVIDAGRQRDLLCLIHRDRPEELPRSGRSRLRLPCVRGGWTSSVVHITSVNRGPVGIALPTPNTEETGDHR